MIKQANSGITQTPKTYPGQVRYICRYPTDARTQPTQRGRPDCIEPGQEDDLQMHIQSFSRSLYSMICVHHLGTVAQGAACNGACHGGAGLPKMALALSFLDSGEISNLSGAAQGITGVLLYFVVHPAVMVSLVNSSP